MNASLFQSTRARIPLQALPVLAGLRCHPGIRVVIDGQNAWIGWRQGDEVVIAQLLAVTGVRFFAQGQGPWFPHDSRLPIYDLPDIETSLPLDQVLLLPQIVKQHASAPAIEPVQVRLVADHSPRPISALLCSLTSLGNWADRAPSFQIERMRGAISGSRVLLRGDNLPVLPEDRRFWGERLLVPLGQRVEPAVHTAELLEAWGALPDEIVLLDGGEAERISVNSLRPLTRAGIRLAVREKV